MHPYGFELRVCLGPRIAAWARAQDDTENLAWLTRTMLRTEERLRGRKEPSPSPYWFSIRGGALLLSLRRRDGASRTTPGGYYLEAVLSDRLVCAALLLTLARLARLHGTRWHARTFSHLAREAARSPVPSRLSK